MDIGVVTWTLILGALLLYIISWIHHRRGQHSLFAKLGVPHVPPHLLYGSNHLLRKNNAVSIDVIGNWIKEYGPVFGYYVGWRPILIVSDLDLVKQVLIKEFHNFTNRPKLVINAEPVMSTVVGLRDQRWKDVRSILAPTFSMTKMKQMAGIMNRKIDVLMAIVDEKSCDNEAIEWYTTYQGLTLDVISECALAMNTNCQINQSKDEFLLAVREFLQNALNPAVLLALYVPLFANLMSFVSNKLAVSGRMTQMIIKHLKTVIKLRRQDLTTKYVDVLQLMLEAAVTTASAEKEERRKEGNEKREEKRKEAGEKTEDMRKEEERETEEKGEDGNGTGKRRNEEEEKTEEKGKEENGIKKRGREVGKKTEEKRREDEKETDERVMNKENDKKELNNEKHNKETVNKESESKGKRDERTKKIKLTDEEIIANAWVFLLGGFETTASALTYTTYLLATYPEVQNKLYQEITQHYKQDDDDGDGDDTFTYDDIKGFKYLDQVLSESLRLYPPVVTFITRESAAPFKLGNTTYPKDMNILIPIWQIHRDPQYWTDPEVFDPDRFSGNNAKTHGMAYLPFGGGPRNCPGMRFAQLEAKLAIARIVRKYRLEVCEKTPNPLTFKIPTVAINPSKGVYIRAVPRLQNTTLHVQ